MRVGCGDHNTIQDYLCAVSLLQLHSLHHLQFGHKIKFTMRMITVPCEWQSMYWGWYKRYHTHIIVIAAIEIAFYSTTAVTSSMQWMCIVDKVMCIKTEQVTFGRKLLIRTQLRSVLKARPLSHKETKWIGCRLNVHWLNLQWVHLCRSNAHHTNPLLGVNKWIQCSMTRNWAEVTQ